MLRCLPCTFTRSWIFTIWVTCLYILRDTEKKGNSGPGPRIHPVGDLVQPFCLLLSGMTLWRSRCTIESMLRKDFAMNLSLSREKSVYRRLLDVTTHCTAYMKSGTDPPIHDRRMRLKAGGNVCRRHFWLQASLEALSRSGHRPFRHILCPARLPSIIVGPDPNASKGVNLERTVLLKNRGTEARSWTGLARKKT